MVTFVNEVLGVLGHDVAEHLGLPVNRSVFLVGLFLRFVCAWVFLGRLGGRWLSFVVGASSLESAEGLGVWCLFGRVWVEVG